MSVYAILFVILCFILFVSLYNIVLLIFEYGSLSYLLVLLFECKGNGFGLLVTVRILIIYPYKLVGILPSIHVYIGLSLLCVAGEWYFVKELISYICQEPRILWIIFVQFCSVTSKIFCPWLCFVFVWFFCSWYHLLYCLPFTLVLTAMDGLVILLLFSFGIPPMHSYNVLQLLLLWLIPWLPWLF